MNGFLFCLGLVFSVEGLCGIFLSFFLSIAPTVGIDLIGFRILNFGIANLGAIFLVINSFNELEVKDV